MLEHNNILQIYLRMSAVKRMEESLHLPIASISHSQAPSLTQESSATYAKSSTKGSTTAAVPNSKQFTRVVSRRAQKTQDYCEGELGTKYENYLKKYIDFHCFSNLAISGISNLSATLLRRFKKKFVPAIFIQR